MSMRVWWVLRGLSGSCFFSSCFYLFSLFHVFLKCHRRPSRQAPGRRANSSWLEERLICILVSRTRSEAVQSLVHWDWLCLPFSFCGRQTMRGQRERGREIIRFQQAQFWERTKLASTVCVCVLCVFMWEWALAHPWGDVCDLWVFVLHTGQGGGCMEEWRLLDECCVSWVVVKCSMHSVCMCVEVFMSGLHTG